MPIPLSRYKQSLIKKEDKPYVENKPLVCNSLYFDGINNYVDCGNDESLNITNAFTISARFKVKELVNDLWCSYIIKDGVYIFIQEQQNTKLLRTYQWTLTPPYLNFNINADDLLGEWKTVTVTFENGGDRVVYVDGIEDIRDTPTGSININTKHLKIGGKIAPNLSTFKGSIVDVRIYNRALSGAEILNLYKNKNVSNEGLILYLPMISDYSNKKIIQDKSEYNNDGVLHGCKWNCNRIEKHAI